MSGETGDPDPALLAAAQDDRQKHPWRYYTLSWPDAQRLLNQLQARIDELEAKAPATLRTGPSQLDSRAHLGDGDTAQQEVGWGDKREKS